MKNAYQTSIRDARKPTPLLLGEDLVQLAPIEELPTISSPDDIQESFGDLAKLNQEVMVAGAVDGQCRLLCWHLIAVGNANQLIIRTGDAFCGAIRHGARGIFLVHNHPAGTLEPSREDLELTRDVYGAGNLLGYPLLDHVIVARTGSRSILQYALSGSAKDQTNLSFWAAERTADPRLIKRLPKKS